MIGVARHTVGSGSQSPAEPKEVVMTDSRIHPRRGAGMLIAALVVALLILIPATGVMAASWSGPRRVANDPPAAMTVDDLGHRHIVTQESNGLRYVTDASGRWTSKWITRVSNAYQPAIALSAGRVYVVYARIGDCPADERGCTTDPSTGLYLATNRTGSWRTQRLAGTRPAYWPSLRMAHGKLHVAYDGRDGIHHLTNASGSWVDERVWSRSSGLTAWARTSIATDAAGHVHIAFMRTRAGVGSQGISYATDASGVWVTRTVTSGDDRLDRIVLRSGTSPRIGFTRSHGDGDLSFRIARFSRGDVVVRVLPGTGHGSFTLDAKGRIEVVRWSDGRLTWRAQRDSGWLRRSWSAPRISVAWVRNHAGDTTIVRDGFVPSRYGQNAWVLTRS